MSGALRFAVRCLIEVEGGGYSNLVFKRETAKERFSAADTAFAAAVFYGTLERQITVDRLLGRCLQKPLSKLDAEVRAILRAGVCQIHYMRSVPVFAAVSGSVALCRAFRKSSAGALVNAALRRAAAVDPAGLFEKLSGAERLSVMYSLNEKLSALLTEQYGEDAEKIMAGFFTRRRPAVRVNTLLTDEERAAARLREEGITASKTALPGGLLIEGGTVLRSAMMGEGLLRPQSLAAQAAVLLLDPRPGERMLDLCAAPGGKTLTAAQRMENRGEILAVDRHSNRLRLLERQAAAERVSIVETLAADGAAFDGKTRGKYDRVLCDVPCSGFGEIGTKPELRFRPPAVDEELENLQYRILESGAACLRPGGRLVYSTCTLDRRENEGVVDRFLQCHPSFSAAGPPALWDFERTKRGYYRLLPSERNAEGFFLAAIEERGDFRAGEPD